MTILLFPTRSPTLLLGPPGIGKTARVKAHFGHTEVVPTSGWTDDDINGLPFREGEEERRTLPPWYTSLVNASLIHDRVCLFFDEIDKTPVSVANTLLTLIESRRHNSIVLPENCAIVAAANSRGEISQALWERFSKIECAVDFPATIAFLEAKAVSEPAKAFITGLKDLTLPLLSLTDDQDSEAARSMIPRTCELFIHAANEYPNDLVALLEYAKGLFPAREVTKLQNLFARSAQAQVVGKAAMILQRKGPIRL